MKAGGRSCIRVFVRRDAVGALVKVTIVFEKILIDA